MMAYKKLLSLLSFSRVINTFQGVERVVRIPETEKRENDVEHSYHLAMLGWYIVDSMNLSLDKDRIIRYALIHDLVEVYAGDTYIYSKNQADHDSKKEREEASRIRLAREIPEFKDLHNTIIQYEEQNDKESVFVYVLDKLHPAFQVYLDGGRDWKKHEITLAMLIEKKANKAELSPELLPYWEELLKILRSEEKILFGEK